MCALVPVFQLGADSLSPVCVAALGLVRPHDVLVFRKAAKYRAPKGEELEDPFVKCDIFNAKPPVWESFVEEPPGTFTRNGKIQKVAQKCVAATKLD
jgi:hypothetical protein